MINQNGRMSEDTKGIKRYLDYNVTEAVLDVLETFSRLDEDY